MGRSDRLRLSEVRDVFRLLGDARDLRHDQVAQDTLIVDGLCNLLGAQLGWGVCFDGFRPGLDTRIERFVPGTVQDPLWMSYLERWGDIGNFNDDPMTTQTRTRLRPVEAVRRSALFSMDDWSAYPIYDNFVDPAGVKDTLVLWFRYPKSGRIRGYSLQRTKTEKEFDHGQVRLARLFAQEPLLHAQNQLKPAGTFVPK